MNCPECGGETKTIASGRYKKCEICLTLFDNNDNMKLADKDKAYNYAVQLFESDDIKRVAEAQDIFGGLCNYRDGRLMERRCLDKITNIKLKNIREQQEREMDEKKVAERKRNLYVFSSVGVVLLIAIIAIIVTVASSNKKKADIQAVEDNNKSKYEEAIAYYESGDYSSARTAFSEINNYKDSNDYLDKIGTYYYELANESYKMKNYDRALDYLAYVDDESEWVQYNKANEFIEKINSELKTNEYNSYLEMYNAGNYENAHKGFVKMSGFLQASNYIDLCAEKIYENSGEAISGTNYLEAYRLLQLVDSKEEWSSYTKATESITELKNTYVNIIKENAHQKLLSEGYDSFEKYVNEAGDNLFTESDKKSLINEYSDCKPILLSTLKVYENHVFYKNRMGTGYSSSDYIISTVTDVLGNKYNDAFILAGHDNGSYATFLINGSYNMFSGTLAFPHDSDYGNIKTEGHVKIYADDTLIYSSDIINENSDLISFNIKLGDNVRFLKIYHYNDKSYNYYDNELILGNAKLYKVK